MQGVSFFVLWAFILSTYWFRDELVDIFINTSDVSGLTLSVDKTFFIAIVGKFFDYWQLVMQGVVRALGIQDKSTYLII